MLVMKYILFFLFALASSKPVLCQVPDNTALAAFFKNYTEDGYKLSPLSATFNGDARYKIICCL